MFCIGWHLKGGEGVPCYPALCGGKNENFKIYLVCSGKGKWIWELGEGAG